MFYTGLDCERWDNSSWFCKNYRIYKSYLLKNEIKDNKFFFNKNLVNKTILKLDNNNYYFQKDGTIDYCYFYQNENKENIIIYLNKNILIHRNIEAMDIVKQIEITDKCKNNK